MPIKLTYKDIRNPDFSKGLKKLADCSDIKNVSVLLKIVKMYKAVANAEKDCVAVNQKLLDQHGTREEDQYKIVNVEGFNKDIEELLKTEFEIECDPIKFNDILAAKLAPSDIHALEQLISL